MNEQNPTFYNPLFVYLIGILCFVFIIVLPFPGEIGLFFRYDYILFVMMLSIFYYIGNRIALPLQNTFYLVIILSLSIITLKGIWTSGISDWHTLGGIIPINDGRIYFQDAFRLVNGMSFSEMSTRRPLFTGFFSTLLFIAHNNFNLALYATVSIVSISLFFAVREMHRTHGALSGFVLLLLLFFFYRKFIGTVLTEHLGLAFGALAFATLWRGSQKLDFKLCVLSLGLLSMGLNARAGAFFVLPIIIIWGGIIFRGEKRLSIPFLVFGSLATVFGFIMNHVIILYAGAPSGGAFSNFPQTFYGLLTGGNWKTVMIDYPELQGLSESQLAISVLLLCKNLIVDNPFCLLGGMLKAWRAAIIGTEGPVFSFIWIRSPHFTEIMSLIANNGLPGLMSSIKHAPYHLLNLIVVCVYFVALNILGIYSLLHINKNYEKPLYSLLICVMVGVFLSLPFAPPWDSDTMRVYAATIPFIAAIPALSLSVLLKKRHQITQEESYSTIKGLLIFSALMIILVSFGPLFVRAVSTIAVDMSAGRYQTSQQQYFIEFPCEAQLIVIDDKSSGQHDHIKNELAHEDFVKGLTIFGAKHFAGAQKLKQLKPPFTLMQTIDLKSGRLVRLIFDGIMTRKGDAVVTVDKQEVETFYWITDIKKVDKADFNKK